ncbi:N-6 DNA Methylase [uncultured archaeon]|nr:N-6 DNA Methylase [uncultured archaeon]
MLDSETKRKIDSCRDILVGKLPDPKSQIEQITIALIYKFMDDMDKQSEELGGKTKFFTGEFEKYSWDQLVSPKLSGHEVITYYNEALLKMNQNKNIPQLFRDIFKNAYLPYRDPETLKSFLKEIDWFNYSHSEKLGDAFEYLLSVMGSQGDAGQFRTPRHIIDFIVKVVDPDKNQTILDPACGTAGFLISAYKHILDKYKDENGKIKLTPDERKKLGNNLFGYDISPDMVRLSLVNLYLHGFPDPKIFEYDTLTSEERWNDFFEVIIANPPFMTPKGGIKPHKRFSIQANRSEVLFVDYIHEHLSPNGKAGIVVPEGIIFQSGNAYQQLRKMLLENSLYAVISLPAGVFNPYSGVKTSILLLDKSLAKKTKDILFIKIENEGFGLGAQRREISGSDLPISLEIVSKYKKALTEGKELELNELEKKHALIIKKDELSGDFNLSQDRYRKQEVYDGKWPLAELGEVAEVIKGSSITEKIAVKGKIPVIAGGQQPAYFHNVSNREGKTITVSASGAYAGFINYFEIPIFASDCTTIQSKDESKVMTRFIYLLLKGGKQEEIYAMQRGGGQPHVYPKDLSPIKIPLPPLEIQEKIVTELESYQNIIDGATKVVENYKPSFKIDPSWEMVELGEVCEKVTDGSHNPPEGISTGKNLMLSSRNIINNTILFDEVRRLKEEDFNSENKRTDIHPGDVLLTIVGTIGRSAVVLPNMPKFTLQRSVAVLKPKKQIINSYFLNVLLQSDIIQSCLESSSSGVAQKGVYLGQLSIIKIPLPPIEVQKQIVERLEEEQKLIDSNKKLIEIFKNKIKDKIDEVWGE